MATKRVLFQFIQTVKGREFIGEVGRNIHGTIYYRAIRIPEDATRQEVLFFHKAIMEHYRIRYDSAYSKKHG